MKKRSEPDQSEVENYFNNKSKNSFITSLLNSLRSKIIISNNSDGMNRDLEIVKLMFLPT